MRELILFAAIGLLIGGVDELCVDAVWLWRSARARIRGERRPVLADLPHSDRRFAIFIAAWDESAVIGRMLTALLTRLDDPALVVFVGTYPNDPATIEAVAEVTDRDPRVRLEVGRRAGPTTKADCLNGLWRALKEHEAWRGATFDAIVLHDAEDVVHPGELTVLSYALSSADAAQLPVIPLSRPGAHLVGGTYLDEFSEAHGKTLAVRGAVGAGLPLAGVGCAISRALIGRIADARGGQPFDANSVTEDYELGLTIAAMGGRTVLIDVAEAPGAPPVAVRAYFPSTIGTAVRQKARWLLGIALAGWDRTGWGGAWRPAELWMRMRDRRGPLAMLVLAAGYAALLIWPVVLLLGGTVTLGPWLQALLVANGALLLWRIVVRAIVVARWHGHAQAALSIPRLLVGNIVAMMAARAALTRYILMLRGAPLRWDKTPHQFPDAAAVP